MKELGVCLLVCNECFIRLLRIYLRKVLKNIVDSTKSRIPSTNSLKIGGPGPKFKAGNNARDDRIEMDISGHMKKRRVVLNMFCFECIFKKSAGAMYIEVNIFCITGIQFVHKFRNTAAREFFDEKMIVIWHKAIGDNAHLRFQS